ncbi:hypothetical protein [Acidithiobacillus sp.]
MIQQRAAGAIMGAFSGDALGLGCHWDYDLDFGVSYSVPKSPGLFISADAVPIRAGGQLLRAVG